MKRQRTKGQLLQAMQAEKIRQDLMNRMFKNTAEDLEDGTKVYLHVDKALNKPWGGSDEYKAFCEGLRGKVTTVKMHEILPNQYYLNGDKNHVFHIADLEVVADGE